MKRALIFILVMALVLVSVTPALAGNGSGGGGRGNGQGGNGNSSGQQGLNASSNKVGKSASSVFTGIIVAIDETNKMITVTVYGGKDTSLYGEDVVVQTDDSTRFLLKDVGAITFADIAVDDTVSVALGSDGSADRVTIGIDCPNIP